MFQDGIKEMDESRQGEVWASPTPPKEGLNSREKQVLPLGTELAGVPPRKLFLESYGCAMNFSDSEIIASILGKEGFETTTTTDNADVIFLNTCAIREGAENKIWARLKSFRQVKRKNPDLIVGVLGCMAERLKTKLLDQEKLVDIVAGPDSYRDLPNLIASVEGGQRAVNVLLSREETYADISPVRLSTNGVSAFISITRGCDNMCSFCVVPFTRGRERSRDPESIVNEARELFENGYHEVTLLGQNVDSYLWHPETNTKKEILKIEGERENGRKGEAEQNPHLIKDAVTFANLLERVAEVNPLLRVRFSTSNPRDITEDVLYSMKKHDNICKYIHLPVQSGNTRILEKMNRGYSREDYLKWIDRIKSILPDCGISTDTITGFCSETEEEHQDTLSLMEKVGFVYAYMFSYSERPGTAASKQYPDDVPEEIKARRLTEVMMLQKKLSLQSNLADINKVHRVLVENVSKRSDKDLSGRNDQNKIVVFPREQYKKGDYVDVLVTECSSATLIGKSLPNPS